MQSWAVNPFASYMGPSRCLQLYEELPVPDGWHKTYARGEADTGRYQHYQWDVRPRTREKQILVVQPKRCLW